MNRRNLNKLLLAAPMSFFMLKPSQSVAQKKAKAPKILMPIGDATEVVDTLYPFFRLQEEGFEVVVCGPEARMYHMVTHEVPPDGNIPWDITREAPGYHLKADLAFKDVNPAEYAGLFVSGGRAPEYLRYDADLIKITKHFFERNKPMAVVCHGVEIVAASGLLKGRKMTTVAKCALDITQVGGVYVPDPLVVDGNLISCRTWADYGTPYMKVFIEQLKSANG